MNTYAVTKRENGTRWYVATTRSLHGGWVGTSSTDRKGRAKRLNQTAAAALAAQLNRQDKVGWGAWEAVRL